MSHEGGESSEGKWFPGKYVGKAMRRSSSTNSPVPSSNSSSSAAVVNTPKVESARRSSVRAVSGSETDGRDIIPDKDERPNSEPTYTRVPLAKVRIKINEIRYLTIKSAKLSIELDDMAAVNLVSDWSYPIVRDFELLNISSDIRLEFRGSGNAPYGVVIVPIASLIKFNGAPIPATQSWREIYPYYDRVLQDFPRSNLKFKSSLPDLPGSAMVKPTISLGFVSFEAEILLPNNVTNVLGFYMKPSPRPIDRSIAPPLSESDYSELQIAVNQAKLQRDIQRIKTALFTPPASVQYFMSVPEIFVLILVVTFLILSISSYQVPLVITLLVTFNGIVAMMHRNVQAVVWNEPGVTLANSTILGANQLSSNSQDDSSQGSRPASISGLGNSAMTTIQAVLKTNQGLQYRINAVAHSLEVLRNLLTFADPRISLIVFGYCFAFAIFSSIFIAILSMSVYLVAMATTLLIVSASYEFFGEQLSELPASSKYSRLSSKVGSAFHRVQNLLSKVPDDLELQHRKIAAAQIVKEGGAEMLDAAAAYQN